MRYTALDSWRGLCAVLVALYHLPVNAGVLQLGLVRHGYLFVDFFFVLSGFVITHAYRDRLATGSDAARFLLLRFARVWPLHVLLLLAFVGLEFLKAFAIQHGLIGGTAFPGNNNATTVATNLLMIHSWGLHDGLSWNYPSWSISAEWAAYLFFASMILASRRYYLLTAAGIGLGCTALAIYVSPQTMDMTFDYGVVRCLASFCLGVLVYALHRRVVIRQAWATALEAAAVFLLVGCMTWLGTGPVTHMMPLVFGTIVLLFAANAGALSQLLNSALMRKLGDWSYSIYMNHALLIFCIVTSAFLANRIGPVPGLAVDHGHLVFAHPAVALLAVVLYLATLVCLSALTYRWIELPAQSYFRARAARMQFSPAVAR